MYKVVSFVSDRDMIEIRSKKVAEQHYKKFNNFHNVEFIGKEDFFEFLKSNKPVKTKKRKYRGALLSSPKIGYYSFESTGKSSKKAREVIPENAFVGAKLNQSAWDSLMHNVCLSTGALNGTNLDGLVLNHLTEASLFSYGEKSDFFVEEKVVVIMNASMNGTVIPKDVLTKKLMFMECEMRNTRFIDNPQVVIEHVQFCQIRECSMDASTLTSYMKVKGKSKEYLFLDIITLVTDPDKEKNHFENIDIRSVIFVKTDFGSFKFGKGVSKPNTFMSQRG